ncbi:MAG TPA: sialidase family protein [Candidatus Angelobacter sp.]|nr:sialidase family protein [Candidatus Angelobacter sp.]
MKRILPTITLLALSLAMMGSGLHIAKADSTSTFDINTLSGKLASVEATPGLFFGLSSFVADEANVSDQAVNTSPDTPITPANVLTSSLDGLSVTAPDVTVNRDTAAASQNEPAIAVNPSNPDQIVVASNDYVTRTWSCFIGSTPCSALGDGYSGTYFSNDGGKTWCCVATDPSNIGTLIPGVERLVGGQYDAGGDPSLAFNSQGVVYYAGLGFDRISPPNTVAVNRGTFDASGNLHFGPPTFIGQTDSPAILNDKEWIGVDAHPASPFRDRVYVSWTRFIFNPDTGAYVQSPIAFAYSTNGGATFTDPQLIVQNVLYDQGSHIVVGPDGTVYVFWLGSTRLAPFESVYMVKSTDGGSNWSTPVAVSTIVNIIRPFNTAFRVNSFPMADIASDGTLYAVFQSEELNSATSFTVDPTCAYFISGRATVYANCHAASYWSKSTDGGTTWSTPSLIFPATDASFRTAVGYPQTQPDSSTLNAPDTRRVDTFFPSIAISTSGRVYMSAYAADTVSPWQACAQPATPTAVGRINCLQLDSYINNARLNYLVTDLTTSTAQTVTTHPINTRYHFGGGFIGDYTGIAVGSDDAFHAVWTDTNNVQTVVWWYGFQFVPTNVHQQDIVTASNRF